MWARVRGRGAMAPQGGCNKEVTRTGPGLPENAGDAVGFRLAVAGLVLVCSVCIVRR